MSDLHQRAVDLSAWLEPSRWRLLAHRHWRKHQQPEDVHRALWAWTKGEYEPLIRLGVQWKETV